jgi:hypothetical protein
MDQSAVDDLRVTRAIIGALREHGLSAFEVWQWLGPIAGPTGGLTEATVLPALHHLEEERLIEGTWQEDERTRRRYRITARGLRLANREGWGPVAFGRSHRTRYGAYSPGAGERAGDTGDGDDEWSWPTELRTLPEQTSAAAGSLEAVAIDAYLDSLQKALHLSPVYCSDVCHEISDHIADASGRLKGLGHNSVDATTEVLEALGPPEVLAGRINSAQLTPRRLRRGLSWASAIATLTGMVGFAVAFDVIEVAVPWLIGLFVPAFNAIGIHLYAPATAEWDSQTLAIALAIGAFVGARRSMPFLADRSRQADSDVWRAWSLVGGLPLLTIALCVPIALDPLAATLMFGAPLMWVLGTRRPARLDGETVTPRGLAVCIVLATILTFLPGGRVWYFDPTTRPASDPAVADDATATLLWQGPQGSPHLQVTAVDLPQGWHDAYVQVSPAARLGPWIGPDPAAKNPSIAVPSGGFVDFSELPRSQFDWWVAVTAVAPDGHTYVIHQEARFGFPTETRTSIVAWLLGAI